MTRRRGRRSRIGVSIGAALWLAVPAAGAEFVAVSPTRSMQAVLDAASSGATVLLLPGRHEGPVRVTKPVTLIGAAGAAIAAPRDTDAAVTIAAPGVTLARVTVRGGWTGVDLLRATGASLSDVYVRGAVSEGIRVYAAPAVIERVDVRDLVSGHAQGIEVLSAPATVVTDSVVVGGKVGIVAHLSDVAFRRNRVGGTTAAGIMIREMSRGSARDNVVTNAAGAGLYCGDQSRCSFADNRVTRVVPGDPGRSSAGWGAVVHFYSTASFQNDVLSGVAGELGIFTGSRTTPRSPLELGREEAALLPVLAASGVALFLVLVAFVVAGRVTSTRAVQATARLHMVILLLLVAGVAVQTFHMAEHVLQVFRVHWDGVPSKGGIIGRVAEPEWVHFAYNALVLAALAVILRLARRGRMPWDATGAGHRLIAAAALIQSYHVFEHSVKLGQHVATGAKVNPGVLGNHIDLVWLHFTINLAVYGAVIAACAAYAVAVPATPSARSGLRRLARAR